MQGHTEPPALNPTSSPQRDLTTHGPGAIATAIATDPAVLGWMQGAPPTPARQVRFDDNSASRFPQLRWAVANYRSLVPTVAVERGAGPTRPLPVALRDDIDPLMFEPMPGSGFAGAISWEQSLHANFTDAIIVVHRGIIVYERYFGVMTPARPHIVFSVSKSLAGLIAAMLIAAGALDEHALVGPLIPELAGSGFGDATLRQLLDMTTALAYSEDYTSPTADIADLVRAAGLAPRRAGDPDGLRDYLPTIGRSGPHGEAFTYRTCNTDVLAWVLHRATGTPLHRLVGDMLWQHLGAEQDGHYTIDGHGTEFAGAGFNATARDLARLGELLRCGGARGGRQVVPAAVVADIAGGGDPAKFAPAGYATLPGWSYRNQWWVSPHGPFTARGVRGQMIWVDPAAELVIARLGSHPLAGNGNFDATSLPAWAAIARHLTD